MLDLTIDGSVEDTSGAADALPVGLGEAAQPLQHQQHVLRELQKQQELLSKASTLSCKAPRPRHNLLQSLAARVANQRQPAAVSAASDAVVLTSAAAASAAAAATPLHPQKQQQTGCLSCPPGLVRPAVNPGSAPQHPALVASARAAVPGKTQPAPAQALTRGKVRTDPQDISAAAVLLMHIWGSVLGCKSDCKCRCWDLRLLSTHSYIS